MDPHFQLQEIGEIANVMLKDYSTEKNFRRRLDLQQLIDGDVFAPISSWPVTYQTAFLGQPMSDLMTFKFFVFFVGNSGSPHLAAEWIFLSQFHSSDMNTFIKRFIKTN